MARKSYSPINLGTPFEWHVGRPFGVAPDQGRIYDGTALADVVREPSATSPRSLAASGGDPGLSASDAFGGDAA